MIKTILSSLICLVVGLAGGGFLAYKTLEEGMIKVLEEYPHHILIEVVESRLYLKEMIEGTHPEELDERAIEFNKERIHDFSKLMETYIPVMSEHDAEKATKLLEKVRVRGS